MPNSLILNRDKVELSLPQLSTVNSTISLELDESYCYNDFSGIYKLNVKFELLTKSKGTSNFTRVKVLKIVLNGYIFH